MDVYHKILEKIYEVTGGKDSESVDLKELVKKAGFFPSYKDIHSQMNRSGWISDTGRGSEVRITHWGIKEARKIAKGGGGDDREKRKRAKKLHEEIKELSVMAEELSSEPNADNLKLVESGLTKVEKCLADLKSVI
ncbi:MAG: hypothetical protein DWQ47_05620 [Acidobacteria bacterium]|nr:MAG: hypothetical protein DWQ32_09170 [Acidobacteriota bacterium]REK01858.1 MAG: hypothetical protein DWQ38_05605 [Acidobacteriota bacterium]REK14814.1 MAG: hypothetical protein DWQ43_14860 [Acidobacteriota bacterium]REK45529.1 MAG: hypothetical protein DWQ47_05620 [Acidobacteriota bacterium]